GLMLTGVRHPDKPRATRTRGRPAGPASTPGARSSDSITNSLVDHPIRRKPLPIPARRSPRPTPYERHPPTTRSARRSRPGRWPRREPGGWRRVGHRVDGIPHHPARGTLPRYRGTTPVPDYHRDLSALVFGLDPPGIELERALAQPTVVPRL